jgi:microcystin-dependent protein
MDPFLGQISLLGCNFAPQGWALCQGQVMAIAQNTALFSLLGINFGGNGTSLKNSSDHVRGSAGAT